MTPPMRREPSLPWMKAAVTSASSRKRPARGPVLVPLTPRDGFIGPSPSPADIHRFASGIDPGVQVVVRGAVPDGATGAEGAGALRQEVAAQADEFGRVPDPVDALPVQVPEDEPFHRARHDRPVPIDVQAAKEV